MRSGPVKLRLLTAVALFPVALLALHGRPLGAGESPNPPAEARTMETLSHRLSQPAYADFGEDQHLTPILPPGRASRLEEWEGARQALRNRWAT